MRAQEVDHILLPVMPTPTDAYGLRQDPPPPRDIPRVAKSVVAVEPGEAAGHGEIANTLA